MPNYDDALRGYAFLVHKRDHFKCVYCGLDGTQSFQNWLFLTQDHLLPKGHTDRDNKDFIVTACHFCNVADNHYFEREFAKGNNFMDLTRERLIEARKVGVMRSRRDYRKFYEDNVVPDVSIS